MHFTTADLPADVDISAVPPQPAVVSYRCPVRVALDHTPARAPHKAPLDPSELVRAQETRQHVADVRAALGAAAATDPTVVVIDPSAPDAIDRTRRAIDGPARIIVGARLPTDHDTHRLGATTVLVRAGRDVTSAWLPVEIRRHAFTRSASGSTALASPLTDPHRSAAVAVADTTLRNHRHNENGRQLAHQWRLLQAMGVVPAGQRATGGVVDRDGDRIWWLDLEDPRWDTRWTTAKVTMLEHYDHGFDFRLRTIAHQAGRDDEPLMDAAVPPVRIGECSRCPWEAMCLAEMESVDHVSLIPRSTFDHYATHRARGVVTRAQVANFDWPTAYAMHGPHPRSVSVDLTALVELTDRLDPSTTIAEVFRPLARTNGSSPVEPVQLHLFGMEPDGATDEEPEPIDPDEAPGIPDDTPGAAEPDGRQLVPLERIDQVVARFAEVGFATVADLQRLDPLTASYSGAPCGHLPSMIDQARAATAGRPFLARGLTEPHVPRADVEVDVDMENVEEGVYLWGTLVSGTDAALAAAGVTAGYHPFYSWRPMDPLAQSEVFLRFWRWLEELRAACAAAGLTFAAYCYTGAEHQKMVQIIDTAPPGMSLPSRKEIDAFVSSAEWVDVYDLVRSALVVGHGLGLKRIAPLGGFHWRDDDAGGLQSMTWHREALTNPDPAVQAENRTRLLAYNEDDVRATLAVRNWLATASIPSIDAWTPGRARAGGAPAAR